MLHRFPHFQKLPPEIRLVVWAIALSEPSVIMLRNEKYPPLMHHSDASQLAQVCKESRDQVIEQYDLFEDEGWLRKLFLVPLHVNFSRSVIFIRGYSSQMCNEMLANEAAQSYIQCVAIQLVGWNKLIHVCRRLLKRSLHRVIISMPPAVLYSRSGVNDDFRRLQEPCMGAH
jgi:hypothetical protein